MKRFLFTALIAICSVPAFSQCAFQSQGGKPHKPDQYSKSSKANQDKSRKEMAIQGNEFDKKKYQAEVKNNNVPKKRKSVMRYM